ncbi:3'-5' DNA helicase [Ceratocystis pirilliformis]|uniref:ATP-dependent DNA helicase n=1 Tax=Ceratocystis pirilliformis TaxID=259994 RepID=A0ABR3Z1Q7_9PEZI
MDDEFDDISDDDLLMALVESEPPQFTAPVSQQSKTNPSQFSQPPRLPVNITISNSRHITTINPPPKALPRPSPPSNVPCPAWARDVPLSISSDRASQSQHESASQQSRSHSLQTSRLGSSSGSATTMCQPSTVQKLNQKRALPSSSNGYEITMYHGVPQPGANGKMRQTTLYGGVGDAEDSYTASGRQYRGGPQEEATHHELDREALKTWQYPMNLGDIREYQFNIVHASLFHNTLVALPTGLGKTLIAAAVMLNYYRWTKSAKLVFVAPTRPLVSQQINACYEVAGIPKHDTSILMGNVRPAVRAEVWASRRVIFTTPQTLENDISRGYADPKSICLLIIDEAHRATGNHSTAKACRRIMNFNKSFRVLALTATPGSTVESVQDVMNNLGISKVEIRTEDSLDIRQYTHQRNIDTHVVDFSHELQTVRELLSQALLPITQKLSGFNVYWGRDPMAISAFTINNNRTEWMRTAGRDANQGVKSTVMAIFSLLSTVAHPIKMLNYHGIIPFFQGIKELRDEVESKSTKSKYKIQLVKDRNFQIMMEKMESWMRDPDFVDHPKLAALKTEIVNHFFDCPDQANSKVIVFSEFRDSTEHITRILNRLPRVKAKAFVGQAASKRSGTDGMKQADQIKAVEEFKKGMFNVLVATSIGEEGLDIGQVDLIVCYDASASPIRMLQRMGRTGRKRSGRVVVLLTRGKEEEKYEKAKDSYLNMQHLIASGETFEYRHDISKRIIPPGIVPVVDKCIIDIPPENSEDANNNPDPNKRPVAKTRKKAPPKKFHMPDGVITGFIKASAVGSDGQPSAPMKRQATPKPQETDFIAPIPNFDDVTLTPAENATFKRIYKTFPSRSGAASHVIEEPGLDRFPQLQRYLRPTYKVSHGNRTKQAVGLFKTLGDSQDSDGRYKDYFDFEAKPNILELSVRSLVNEDGSEIRPVLQSGPATPDLTVPQKRTFDDLDISNFDFEDHILPPPGKDIFHADPEELGDNNQVIVNRIPGRAPLRRKPPPPVRHKTPTALYPSSPARLYNVVSDDDTDHSGNTRPAKKNKSAGSKAKSSAPQPKKNTKPKGKATGRSSARTEKPQCFGEAELGDECDRTSDMYYSGDSDDCGSDLEDFIDDRESSQLAMEIDDSCSECTIMDDFNDPFDMTDDDDKPRKKKKTTSNKSKARSKTKASSKPSTSHAKPQRKRLVAAADLSQVPAPPSSVAGNGTACPVILSDDEDGEMPSLGHLLGPSKSQETNGEIPKSNIMAASNSTREKPIRKVVADSEEENYGFDDDDDDFDFLL